MGAKKDKFPATYVEYFLTKWEKEMNDYSIQMKSKTKHGKLWGTVVRGVSLAYAEKRVEQLKREGFEARVKSERLVA